MDIIMKENGYLDTCLSERERWDVTTTVSVVKTVKLRFQDLESRRPVKFPLGMTCTHRTLWSSSFHPLSGPVRRLSNLSNIQDSPQPPCTGLSWKETGTVSRRISTIPLQVWRRWTEPHRSVHSTSVTVNSLLVLKEFVCYSHRQ